MTPYWSQLIEDRYHWEQRYAKVPILDPVEGEHAPLFCLDPPSPDEVMRSLPDDTAGGIYFLTETHRNNVRIVVENIVDDIITPADQFTFLPGTVITGISPTTGPIAGGNTITITGTGFTGTTAVTFQQFVGFTSHTRPASFTVDSDTQITATVPPAPGGVSGNAKIGLLTPLAMARPAPHLLTVTWAQP